MVLSHKLPEGQLSYSKTKVQFNEFDKVFKWWKNRDQSEVSWKVNINDLENFNLDIKNPNIVENKKMLSIDEALENTVFNPNFLISEFKKIKEDLKMKIKNIRFKDILSHRKEVLKPIEANNS